MRWPCSSPRDSTTPFAGPVSSYLGSGSFLLGPVFGTVLGASFGTVTGTLVTLGLPPRWTARRWLVILATLGPLSTALFGLGEFYWGPAIYAYDPFVGYFAGPLYDTIPFDLERLVLFRAGSVLSLGAFWLAGRAVWLDRKGGGTPRLSVSRSAQGGLAVVLALASLTHAALSPALGPGHDHREPCSGPSAVAPSARRVQRPPFALGEPQDRRARRLGVRGACATAAATLRPAGRRPADHRPALLHFGREGPPDGRPHDVSGQAVAARGLSAGRRFSPIRSLATSSPMRSRPISAPAHFALVAAGSGSCPIRGRVEGFAVAAAPTEEGDATEAEWARALLDLGQLPPSKQLFSLGFLGSAAVKSYTAAGAFVAHLHGIYGPARMKRWYHGEDLEHVTGKSWAALEVEYRRALKQVPVSSRVRALAEEVFSRPSVFGRSCPHAADRALAQAQALCPINAGEAKKETRSPALDLDPTRRDAEGLLPSCYLGAGQRGRAEVVLHDLRSSPNVSVREKGHALVTLGDLAWVAGREHRCCRGLRRSTPRRP